MMPFRRRWSRRVDLQTDFEGSWPSRSFHGVRVHEGMGPGAIIEELYGRLVEAVTVEPTFYTDFPAETSPLAAPHRNVPGLAERWDLVINGMEMGAPTPELTDALVQRERLTEQSLKAAAGDPEAMRWMRTSCTPWRRVCPDRRPGPGR